MNLNGKVKIIEDEKGRRLFPSIVTYLDDGGAVHSLINCCSVGSLIVFLIYPTRNIKLP